MDETSNAGQASGKIRVGLVGVGNWALHGHLRVLELLPEYEVVAVYARRRGAAEAAAKRHNIATVLASVKELTALPEVNLVAVSFTRPRGRLDASRAKSSASTASAKILDARSASA
jgi:hypothetical protein